MSERGFGWLVRRIMPWLARIANRAEELLGTGSIFHAGCRNVLTLSHDVSLSPRLFSLLDLIERALIEAGLCSGTPLRSADFRKGVARMMFPGEGGGVLVQNFQMADGQLCARVRLSRPGAVAWEGAIYPQARGFDWSDAASRIVQNWPDQAIVPENTEPVAAG